MIGVEILPPQCRAVARGRLIPRCFCCAWFNRRKQTPSVSLVCPLKWMVARGAAAFAPLGTPLSERVEASAPLHSPKGSKRTHKGRS